MQDLTPEALSAYATTQNDLAKAVEALLLPDVTEALAGEDYKADILDAVQVVFDTVYQQRRGTQEFVPWRATAEKAWEWFQDTIEGALDDLEPDEEDEHQARRMSSWLSIATINGATLAASERSEMRKVWTTRLDDRVRAMHRPLHGVDASLGGTFDVGGYQLLYPGQPVGPPEVWINCRCILYVAQVPLSAASHDLIWYEGRRTPEVVAKGAKGKKGGAGTKAGKVVKRRAATADEEKDIRAGRWVRVEPGGKTPKDKGYKEAKKSKIRPQNNALETDMDSITADADIDLLDEPEAPEGDFEPGDPMSWHGVLVVEGSPSGDGRMFSENAITWRDLPLPLSWQKQSGDGHAGSVVVGRIDGIERVGNELIGHGVFMDTPEADEVVGLMTEGALRGVSVDVDDAEMVVADDNDLEAMLSGRTEFSKGRICGATIVPIPAFPEASLALGEMPTEPSDETVEAAVEMDEFRDVSTKERKRLAKSGGAMKDGSYPIANCQDLKNAIQAIGRAKDPEATKRHIRRRKSALGCGDVDLPDSWAVETEEFKRGPGWVTHPRETARLHRYWTRGPGAAKIGWGAPHDFYRCRRQLAKYIPAPYLNRTCAEWHHDALGYWPGQHALAADATEVPCGCSEDTAFIADPPASESVVNLVASATTDPAPYDWFTDPELEGPTPLHVKDNGRVYGHLATWGTCHIGIKGVCTEPPSSHSNYGYFATGQVVTDQGLVPVGQLTCDTGHAELGASASDTRSHYDHTGTVVADVAVGEDEFGIWVAGRVRPSATPEQVAALTAGALSGDWRTIRGNLELVAALVVNVPGFPVPRTGLAASAGEQTSLVAAGLCLSAPSVQVDAKAVAREALAILDRRERVRALHATVNAERVQRLNALVEGV